MLSFISYILLFAYVFFFEPGLAELKILMITLFSIERLESESSINFLEDDDKFVYLSTNFIILVILVRGFFLLIKIYFKIVITF